MVVFAELEVSRYTRNLSGVLPSLIAQIHQQQIKVLASQLLTKFAASSKRREVVDEFQQKSTRRQLLLTGIEQSSIELNRSCILEIVAAWGNALAEKQRQEEEKRRLEIETELINVIMNYCDSTIKSLLLLQEVRVR